MSSIAVLSDMELDTVAAGAFQFAAFNVAVGVQISNTANFSGYSRFVVQEGADQHQIVNSGNMIS